MTRKKRSAASFVSLLLLQVISVSIGIFSTPLLVQWLGDERYGAIRAAIDLGGYVLLFELGIGGSLCAILANAVSRNDRDEVQVILSVGIRAYVKLVALMLLVGLIIAFFIPRIIATPKTSPLELQVGYLISLVCILLMPLDVFQMLTDVSQRSYIKHAVLIFQSIAFTGLSLWFAWLGFGIPGQFLALVIGANLFSSVVMSWDGFRRYPELLSTILHPPAEMVHKIEHQLWQLNLPTLMMHLSGRISLLTDNLILSYYLSSAAVVPFVITQRLANLVQSQLQSVGLSTWAALADLHHRGARDEFNGHLVDLTKMVVIVGLTMMIPVAAYNVHFVTFWMGAERFGGWSVNLLVACNGILRGIILLWEWCFTGTGNVPKMVRLSVVGAIVNAVVSLIATARLGMIGPLLGTFVSYVVLYSWWMPWLLQQVFGTSPSQLLGAIVSPLFVSLPYGAVVLAIATHHTPLGWLGLLSEMGCAALLHLCLVWYLVLSSKERTVWGQRFSEILSWVKPRAIAR